MADIEKVIKGLEYCIKSEDCRGCIYWEEIGLHEGCPLNSDALALLKEKEAVVRCKDCKYGQYCTDGETTYECFKWNSGEFGVLHEQNWFCADGVRME